MKKEYCIDVNEGKMDADFYFNQLVKDFPMIRKEVEEEDSDMIHMRMECFAKYTIEQIKSNNDKELKRCFAFQEYRIDMIDSKLENALIVSFCESMLLGEVANQMEKIVDLMPDKLKAKYIAYKADYNMLVESSKRKSNTDTW